MASLRARGLGGRLKGVVAGQATPEADKPRIILQPKGWAFKKPDGLNWVKLFDPMDSKRPDVMACELALGAMNC